MSSRVFWFSTLVVLVGVAGFTVMAQVGPANPGAAEVQGPPGPSPSAPGAPAAGRGGAGAAGQAPGGRGGSTVGADFSPKPPIQARTPAEEQRSFIMPTGYRMDLIASDPDVVHPSIIEFDGNGRMYIGEMRTYMNSIEGDRQHDRESRISRWEDTDGDGTFDKHTVFIDHLVLPRAILPLDNNSIAINETDSDDFVQYWDTNNDGVADKKQVLYTGVGRGRDGNLEHEQAGFLWAMDNWIYSTYNAFRIRWTPTGILSEPTAPNGGQWGLSQDDDGKTWWVDAGGERGPTSFQIPVQYGAFSVTDGFEPGFEVVWPAPGIADMQGGMSRVRMPVGNLNHFTAATGPDIVRGDRMPDDLKGDLLFTEPVGRLIRRAKIVKTDGLTQLRNAYPGSEFVLSTDPLFRPVNLETAPDGTVYVADMYHGIIQEATWSSTGYLRQKVEQYQLDKLTGHGRVWRLSYEGIPPSREQPRMLNETAAQLVTHLTHPNGWWRDMAQRLLVLKQDKSVAPALRDLARSSPSLVGRFHALWTLEGLGRLDAPLVREQMKDASPRMRVQAIRASETLYKAGDKSLEADYRALMKDADPDVAIQAMLTSNTLKLPGALTEIKALADASTVRGVKEIGGQLSRPVNAAGRGGRGGAVLAPEEQQQLQRGEATYKEICFSCHGDDGRGAPLEGGGAGVTRAPGLEGSPRVLGHRDYVIKVLLHGLTGPIAGSTFTEVMIPMGTNPDQWVADVGSYVRNSFGNAAPFITAPDVARVRAATAGRKTSWTFAELTTSVPVAMEPQPTWKASASHNSDQATRALGIALVTGAWSTGAAQRAGMWYQVELPEAVSISEIQMQAGPGAPAGRGGFGAGGRGAAPGGPGAAPGPGGAAVGSGAAAGGGVTSPAPGTPATAAPAGAPATTAPVQAGGGGAAGQPGGGGRGAGFGGGRGGAPAAPVIPGFPLEYQVQVSLDGQSWGTPVAKGPGRNMTVIPLTPVRAKFVRITQTANAPADAPFWSIQRLRIYQVPRPTAAR